LGKLQIGEINNGILLSS